MMKEGEVKYSYKREGGVVLLQVGLGIGCR